MLKRSKICVVLVSVWSMGVAPAPAQSPPFCRPDGRTTRVAALPEASGLTRSLRSPNRFWAHNDSGKPELVALDKSGNVEGRVVISGAAVEDWEAITTAHCGNEVCLYVADIGDNDARRRDVVIYRVNEPAKPAGTAKVAQTIRATYPDGSHDAEALLAGPDGVLYVVTKGETGAVSLYRLPPVDGDAAVKLERVGKPLVAGKAPEDARVTDAAISADGSWVALRSKTALRVYRASDFLEGTFKEHARVDLSQLSEPQGEGVTFGSDSTIHLAGEGGGKSQPGTFATLTCRF